MVTSNIEPTETANTRIANALERIATSQEQMVAIAMEARNARVELSAKLQEKLKQPFEGK